MPTASPPSPSQPSATSEPGDPSPTPAPAPIVAWEVPVVPETRNASSTLTVVRGGDGYVAIGFDGGFGSLLWTSSDGRTWRDVTPREFASIGLASVIELDGGLLGVGRGDTTNVESQEAAVYRSDDGLTWRKVETAAPLLGQMIDVVATDDGLFAVGGVPGADSAGVWRSTDGEAWEVSAEFEHAFLWAISEGGPGLVAVGWRRNPEPDLSVWTSANGADWTLAADPEGFAGYEATDVVDLDGTLVMTGSSFTGDGGRIWTSMDGETWELAELPAGAEGAYGRALVATPYGVVALGGGADMVGRAWVSADGRAWEPLGEPVPGAFFQGALVTDDGLIVTGGTQSGTQETGIEAHAQVWLATVED